MHCPITNGCQEADKSFRFGVNFAIQARFGLWGILAYGHGKEVFTRSL